jgi:hypothetical protein
MSSMTAALQTAAFLVGVNLFVAGLTTGGS